MIDLLREQKNNAQKNIEVWQSLYRNVDPQSKEAKVYAEQVELWQRSLRQAEQQLTWFNYA